MNKSKIFYIAIAGIFALSSNAKIPVPQKHRLSDNWQFLRSDLGSIWETVRPVKQGQPEEYPLWQYVSIPHCFNAEDCVDPDVNYYQGPGWYKTSLDINNPYKEGRIILEFEGAGQKTDVYVYTTKVGNHVGGYDSWNVDITDAVGQFMMSEEAKRFNGKVPVSIRCDNSRDAQMIPSDISDFNIYGGIYRHLNLIYLPPVAVDQIHVDIDVADNLKSATVSVSGSFYNKSDVRKADVHVAVKSPDGKTLSEETINGITPLGTQKLHEYIIKNPVLWDVESPQRYTCEVTVNANGESSTSIERFGVRKFEFIDNGPFFLNGRRLLLRGTHRHEDHAGVAAAMTDSMMYAEIKMMKEMGVNFIRLGHYQQSENILNLCDSLGILVWEEIPWCRGGLGGEKYRRQAKSMLSNMISQHYNHPSVIIWGLGNENDWPNDFPEFEQREIREFMCELNDMSHTLDPTRKTAIRRCDFCSDIVDVYSPSIWAGWYQGNFHQYQDFSKNAFNKVRHFLHVEWGGDSHPGRFVEDSEPSKNDWSESYLVRLIDWHLKEQEDMPWLTGTAYWPFKDFSTPVRPENPVPYVNQKGVVERDLTKKESYYVFQSYWTKTPMIHILGHSQPVRWGEPEEEKEILVYSNCNDVDLFVNGISQGIRHRDPKDYPAAGLHWSVVLQPGDNVIEAIAVGKKGIPQCKDMVNWVYETEKWGDDCKLNLSATPIDESHTRIDVIVVDKNGKTCLDSKRFVRFELAGDGKLIKNLGTVGASSKVQVANGKASITVEKVKNHAYDTSLSDSDIAISVKSDGLPSSMIII